MPFKFFKSRKTSGIPTAEYPPVHVSCIPMANEGDMELLADLGVLYIQELEPFAQIESLKLVPLSKSI